MKPIADPFKEDIDFDPKTTLADSEEAIAHAKGLKARLQSEAEFKRIVQEGVCSLAVDPEIEAILMREIHKTVTYHDDHIIRVAFAAGLSAYNKPLNLALKGESSSGKTYSTMETTSFLPSEDIETLNFVSPKVFIHTKGTAKVDIEQNGKKVSVDFDSIPEPQKPCYEDEPDKSVYTQLKKNYVDDLKKYRELKSSVYYEIDFRNETLIYMEGIDPAFFKTLKTTMSRDNQLHGFNDSLYVDKEGNVHKTRFIGSPAMIFNSVDSGDYNNEFATRCLTATPCTSIEKLRAANSITAKRAAYPNLFAEDRIEKVILQEYFRKVRDTLKKGKIGVINPFPELDKIFNVDASRAMRDFSHFIELVAPFTMMHLFQRPLIIYDRKRCLVPTVQDVLDAKATFDKIVETTQTNADNRLLMFYWSFVSPYSTGATAEVIAEEFNKDKRKKTSIRTVYNYLETLEKLEYVDARPGEQCTKDGRIDKQKLTYHPLRKRENNANLLFTQDLKPKLEEDFKTWLKTSVANGWLSSTICLAKIDGSAYQISVEELETIVLENNNALQTIPLTTEVSLPKEDLETQTDTVNNADEKSTLFYRRLAPNESKPCDGEAKGSMCALLAAYEMLSSDNPVKPHYCEDHFKLTRISCKENGFTLVEEQPQQSDYDEKEGSS